METDHGRATSRAGSPLIAEASGATLASSIANLTNTQPTRRPGRRLETRRSAGRGRGGIWGHEARGRTYKFCTTVVR